MNRRLWVRSQNVLGHVFLGLFVVVFLVEADKLAFRAGWVSVPGGAIVVYGSVVIIAVAGSLAAIGPSRLILWHESVNRIWADREFLLGFLGLLAIYSVYWLVDISVYPVALVDIIKSFFVCVSSVLLMIMCSHMRRAWRWYLGISFVVYCLSIWIDALRPGIFTELAGFGNFITEGRVSGVSGFNLDSNSGSYIVALLAIMLLDYERLKITNLAVLSFAGLSILLTLSRSGLLMFILVVVCYFALIFVKSPERRRFVSGAFVVAAIVTMFCGWAAIRFIEHFETPKARIAVGQLLIQDEWFRTRLRASSEDLIQTHLEALAPFGQVNAPKAPRPTVPELAGTEPIAPTAEPAVPGIRSYITYVDGGEYVHIESRRIARLRNAIDAIRESPWIGHGIGFNQNAGISAHSMFLAMWIDFGFLGLILYLTFLIIGFWKFYRAEYWLGIFFMLVFSVMSIFIQHIFSLYNVFFTMGLVLSLRPNDTTDTKLSVS